MISQDEAFEILATSTLDYIDKNTNLNVANLLAEVVHNACLHILIKQKEEAAKQTSFQEMLANAMQGVQNNQLVIKTYTDAAKELFPQHFDDKKALMVLLDVNELLGEKNPWEKLKDYFKKYHNHNIEG